VNIPDKIKIGGKTYKVEVTKNLDLGSFGCSAEINYCDVVIRIVPNAQQRMEADLIHEMVHAIYDHMGYTKHDEKKVDELAQALYMVIQDNPEMFERNGGNNEAD